MVLQVQIGEQKLEEMELLPLLTRYQLLPRLAQDMIIDQAIATTPELKVTKEEMQGAVNAFMQQRQFKSEDELKNWLNTNGLTLEQFPMIISRPILLEKFKRQRWGDNLETYFVQRKSKLDRIIYSLIRTDDPGVAQELYFRILDDPSIFPDIARKYSKGAEAQTGGLVGPVEMSTPHPMMMQMLSSSQPGELKPPVKIGEWFVILRLEKMSPAKLDDQMKKRLINEQFEQWLNQEVQEKVVIQHSE